MSHSAQLITQLDKAAYIRAKRQRMGLSQQAFATLLDMKENGERTVRGWENGEHAPTPAKFNKIVTLPEHVPFRPAKNTPINFKILLIYLLELAEFAYHFKN